MKQDTSKPKILAGHLHSKLLLLLAVAGCAAFLRTAGGSPLLFSNGHYYEYLNTPLSWTDSKSAAEQLTYLGTPGHLATITSATEQSFIYNQVFQPYIPPGASDYSVWLGAYQPPGSPEPAGGWTWVTGEQLSYANWYPGEPNNFGGGEDKLCMIITGLWDDYYGDRFGAPWVGPIGYIVEFDVPEPSLVRIGILFLTLWRLALLRKKSVM